MVDSGLMGCYGGGLVLCSRDEHGSGLDRTGSGLSQFWPDEDWIGLQFF